MMGRDRLEHSGTGRMVCVDDRLQHGDGVLDPMSQLARHQALLLGIALQLEQVIAGEELPRGGRPAPSARC